MNKKILVLSFMAFASVGIVAQKNVGELFQAGINDGNKLAKAYLRPYGEMLGTNLNAGWYTSAAPHKILGFDVTLMASYTMVPSSAESFDVEKLGLTNFNVSSANTIAPTMAGKSSQLPTLTPKVSGGEYVEFDLPNGSGANTMISPMIQAGVGLPKGTELMVRFMPAMDFGDYGKMGLWGVGVKHSLKDYIPFVKRVPFWNVSVLGAYTKFTSDMSLPDNNFIADGDLNISSGAFTTRLLIGANFPLVALYTGIGYGSASSNFDISGSYKDDPSTELVGLTYDTSGVDFNVGARIRLGVIAIHADYSVGDYNMLTAGLGLSFR